MFIAVLASIQSEQVMNRSHSAAILGIILLFTSYPVFSDTRGSVHGRAFDPSGAVIVGAGVIAKNIVSGQSWMAQTNEAGEYGQVSHRSAPIDGHSVEPCAS